MKLTNSVVVTNPPKAIAEAFGFSVAGNYQPPADTKKRQHTNDNTEHRCKRCGIVQKSGMIDPAHTIIGDNSNDMYDFAAKDSPFLCDYCIYNSMYYKSRYQKKALDQVYGDIANVVITDKGYKHFVSKADESNELYDILKNPPKEPCLILIKEIVGASFNTAYYNAEPTISPDLLVIFYGREKHTVSPKRVFALLDAFVELKERFKQLKPSEDIFFNRSMKEDYNVWFTHTLRANREFVKAYGEWMSEWSRSERLIAKMILKRYIKETKKGADDEQERF